MRKRVQRLLGARRLVLHIVAFVAAIVVIGTPLTGSGLGSEPIQPMYVNWNNGGG